MASPNTKTKETSAIKSRQKFEGHTEGVWGIIHLPDRQRIITCSLDGSLRVWSLKSGKQIGEDWRDGESEVKSIALSPDGKNVASGSQDGAVRLWDIDTCKVIAKWKGHTQKVVSVCWSRDGRRVLSGSEDGTARQWDVEKGETILELIETGHTAAAVWAVMYSPDMTLIATGGRDGPSTARKFLESSVKIWDAETGKLVTTLKGHNDSVRCLAWTKDGKTLVSGSYDDSIRTWDTAKWEQTAVLEGHTHGGLFAIAISPNDRILASASYDKTARLWNLENGQPVSSPLQHAESVDSVSFSENGQLLVTGCRDKNVYSWDVAAILREAGLNDLLLDPKANKWAFRANATRRLIQQRPSAYRQGFFDGVPPAHSSARSRPHPPGSTFISRLFHRSPSDAHDTSPSSPLDWARSLLKWRGQNCEGSELQRHSPAVVEVPYAKGKRRNACAREVAPAKQKQKMKPLHLKNPPAGSSQLPKPNVAKPSPQPQAADSLSTTPGNATTATTSTPSCPDIMIRQAGLWTRFWLLICSIIPAARPWLLRDLLVLKFYSSMASPTVKTKETSAITPCQKFEGHTDFVWGAIHLPDRQRIITCSWDGSLRVWNLKSGKQIGEDWRDGKSRVQIIVLSPDGKKVVSGCEDGTVRLWDIDTCKVIAKWMGHTQDVVSICWSRDGRRVLSGSNDGTARQWNVESGETILEPIVTGHTAVWAVVYSPDMTLIATGGIDGPLTISTEEKPVQCSVKIWDTKTGKLVTTLKGHTLNVRCLAWTADGKTLISGSFDHSIRTWDTTKWEQTAILEEHTDSVMTISISANGRILASASFDETVQLWNLDNGKPIGSPLQHAESVDHVSFSEDGKLLATGCRDKNAYTWDVAAIVKEAGLDDLLSDSKANKSAHHVDATRSPVQRRPPAYQVPHGFFDGVPPAHSAARSHPHSSAPPGSTFLSRLFHRSPSSANDTLPSSPLNWVRNRLKWRRQSNEGTELQGHSLAIVEVPYAKGKRRNASARETRKTKPLRSKISTTGNSQLLNNGTQIQPSSQAQAADSSLSTTPAIDNATAAATSTPSRPQATIRDVGLWTRFWLFIGCISPEYTDGDH
ncbi:hypothetical protein EV702DRAFT_1279780 [Suillus placidus]|uniref:WD40 repeat-like protein n=1 Tax=Suillus placidus TaxID=48579 RepID=A0A9P7D1J8_9AGAM|nr:hypothetical protein EV702DRAFT_1279780 [Suillus placidus]